MATFVKRASIAISGPLAICVVLFVAFAALGIRIPWFYEILVLLIVGLLLSLIVIALPLLILSQTIFDLLPQVLQNAARTWQRRGGIILFCGLAAIFVIKAFKLWQAPDRMLTVVGIVALLWLGGALGWLAVSDTWRRVLAAKLWLTLIIIAIITMLPGPAGLVEELANWTGDKVQASVHGVTRPTPARFYPSSADELRASFVDRGTGSFLVWYYQDDRGDYQFYRSKGYDEFGGELRHASSQTEFESMVKWQRAIDTERESARRVQEAEAARQRDEARDAEQKRFETEQKRAEEESRAKEKARVASYVARVPTEEVRYVVLVVEHGGQISTELTHAVAARLATSGSSAMGNVFTDAFVCPEGFDLVMSGKGGADLAAMGVAAKAERVLLIRAGEPTFTISNKVSGVRTCTMRMAVAVIDAQSGNRLSQFTVIDVSGAGVSDDAAKAAFVDRFVEHLAGRSEVIISS